MKFGFSDEDDGVVKSASEFGFGFQLAAGKEWWISENWGLGASVAITYGSVDEDDGVGILLDGTGVTEVREHRRVIVPLLRASGEL